jgi:hypothetical protein
LRLWSVICFIFALLLDAVIMSFQTTDRKVFTSSTTVFCFTDVSLLWLRESGSARLPTVQTIHKFSNFQKSSTSHTQIDICVNTKQISIKYLLCDRRTGTLSVTIT